MDKLIDKLAAPGSIAALAVPPLVWLSVATMGRGLSVADAAGAGTFRIFYGALAACIVVAVYRAARRKQYGRVLTGIGIVLVLLQGVFVYAYRFSGKAAVGEGESAAGYYAVDAGCLASVPALPVRLQKVLQKGSARVAVLAVDGREMEASKEQQFLWKDYRLTLKNMDVAPLFILRDPAGLEIEAGYVKLAFHETANPDFQFAILPHRFYVSLPGAVNETWRGGDGSWQRSAPSFGRAAENTGPGVYRLAVVRGKLNIAAGEVRTGDSLKFDGYSITLGRGAPWVELQVTRVPSFAVFYAGLALISAGVLLCLRYRRPA